MGELIVQILTSTIIVSLLLSALIFLSRNLILERLKNAVKHDYDKKLKEYENELNTHTQIQMAKLTSQLTVELEIAKTKIEPYSERQFELYNELWVSLCDLKYAMLQLWDQASEEKYNELSKKLETTTIQLEKSALVVEEHHYIELISILNEFAKYEMGKRTLIDYRCEQPRASYNPQRTRDMIDDNRATKKKLLDYLPQMMSCLRNQINGKSISEQRH
jgi:hypothetical protein